MKIRKLLFFGIVLLVALEILVSNASWINYKLFLAQIISGLLLLLCAFGLIGNKNFPVRSSLNIPLLIYLLWIFISFFLSPCKSASLYSLYNILLLVILYFLAINSVVEKKELTLLVNLWLTAGVLVSIGAILHYKNEAIVGSFGNPNLFAAFLVSTIPFSLIYLFKAQKRLAKILYSIPFIILALALYLTKSRGGIGAGIVSILLSAILWVCFKTKENKVNFKTLLLILFLVAGLLLYAKLILALDLSLKGRGYIWQGAMSMIKEKPFLGYGIGNFVVYFSQFGPSEIFKIYPDQFVNSAHNEFLTVAAELGLIGLGLFLWFLSKVFLLAKKNLKIEDRYLKSVSLAAFSSIAGIILINIFDVSLRFAFTALFFWLAIAILVIVDRISRTESGLMPGEKNLPFSLRIIVSLTLLFMGVRLISYATHTFWATNKYNKSSSSFVLNLNKNGSLIKEAEERVKNNGSDAIAYFHLGTVYAKKMDWQNARNYLEKAIAIDRHSTTYNNLGNVYLSLGEVDRAIDSYRKAIEVSPAYLNAHYNLGFAYFRKIQIKDAVKEFDFVLSKNRNDFQAWQMRQLIFE